MQSPPFLKKFDFRGIYNQDITDTDAYYLAIAFSKTLGLKKILLGWDTRVSSKNLAMAFINGIKNTGVQIYYLDVCPIDYVTAAANAYDFDLSIMFTGSHNPWNWSGLLIHTKGGHSLSPQLVETVIAHYNENLSLPYTPQPFDLSLYQNFEEEIEKTYAAKIRLLIPLHEIPYMNVLVDVGDGSGYKSLRVLEQLLPQVRFLRINDRTIYDEHSSHTADPSEIQNMTDLINNMKQAFYTVGFAFDSDADRVLAVDETGAYINGSLFASALVDVFAKRMLTTQRVGYAVDCGPSLYNTVIQHKQENNLQMTITPIPVGRSLVRQLLFENKLDVGAENVGHFYLRDFFMTDSAVFALTVMLYWMSQYGKASTLFQFHPDGKRDQLFLPKTTDAEIVRDTLLGEVAREFPQESVQKIALDGLRYELFRGPLMTSWISVRQSGYENLMKYYYGSLDQKEYTTIKAIVDKKLITQHLSANSDPEQNTS